MTPFCFEEGGGFHDTVTECAVFEWSKREEGGALGAEQWKRKRRRKGVVGGKHEVMDDTSSHC